MITGHMKAIEGPPTLVGTEDLGVGWNMTQSLRDRDAPHRTYETWMNYPEKYLCMILLVSFAAF